jgi:putative membrane protein
MRFLIKFILSALSIMGIAYLLPQIYVSNFQYALITALVLGLLNTFVRPVVKFLTLPITLVTLGLFLLVINAGMILLADYFLGAHFEVDGFLYALLFSVLYYLADVVIELFFGEKKEKK